jgi:hypothetical protein
MAAIRIRYTLSTLFCLLFGHLLTAQVKVSDLQGDCKIYNEWGISAGGNFQQLIAFPFARAYNPGAVAGAYVSKRKKMFGLQAALTVSSGHFETEFPLAHSYQLSNAVYADKTSKGVFDVLYINIPLLAEIRPVNWLGLRMGATYSYMPYINDNNGAYGKIADVKKLFKAGNISATTGLSLKCSQSFSINANYNIGFSDINNHTFQGLTDKWLLTSGNLELTYRIKKWYPARMWQFNKRKY